MVTYDKFRDMRGRVHEMLSSRTIAEEKGSFHSHHQDAYSTMSRDSEHRCIVGVAKLDFGFLIEQLLLVFIIHRNGSNANRDRIAGNWNLSD